MKQQRLMIAGAVVVILGALGIYSFQSSGQQPVQQAPRIQVNIVDVKPDMIDAWIEFQTQQTVPALKKAGVMQRDVYQTALGPLGRFLAVTPIGKFADRDNPGTIERALGAAGAKAYTETDRKLIAGRTTLAVEMIPDASFDPNPDAIYKVLVLSINHVAPGRGADFVNYVRNDLMPVQKKGQVKRFSIGHTLFGRDPNEYGTATWMEKFADLDAGPAVVRVLGQDGAAKLTQKTVGIVTSIEREVYVRNDALSFRTRPTS
jgi:hypothetical protein